jgi:hypothetical protein
MNRLISAIIACALLVAAPAALAKSDHGKRHKKSPRATVLRGALKPVQADQAAYTAVTGKIELVDTKRNDKLTLSRVRGLAPRSNYTWHLHRAAGDPNPCDAGSAGPVVTQFGEGRFRTDKKGSVHARHLRARGKDKFTVNRAETYYVEVHQGNGAVVACGVLKAKKAKKPSKKHSRTKADDRGHGHGKGRDDSRAKRG